MTFFNKITAASILTLIISGSAAMAKGPHTDINIDPPPRVDIHDYNLYFAGPVQTAYVVINDRGDERGPYASYEEAHEAGMEQWWIIFEIEEIQLPQYWIFWGRYDSITEAASEASWLRSLGFDTDIERVPEINGGKTIHRR